LPAPSAPAFWLLPDVIFHSLPIAVVGFTITLSMASILAKKGHYRVKANQEFIACVSFDLLSLSNLFNPHLICPGLRQFV